MQLAVAAEAIGITEDELRAALEEGQSIAQVAEANDVDVQTVIDAMVAAATERLEAAIDELPDRMAEVVEREGPARSRPRWARVAGHFGAGLDAAAEAIGIESEELRAALGDGSTIAEVAEANGVEVQTVIDALVADAEAHARRGGGQRPAHRGQGRRDKANLPERIEAMVNGEGPLRWPRWPGGRTPRSTPRAAARPPSGTSCCVLATQWAPLGAPTAASSGQEVGEVDERSATPWPR